MSRRSHNSVAQGKRISKFLVVDDDLYRHVLGVALIHHDLTYKAAEIHSTEIKEKETHSRLQGAISNSILSIGDLFKDLRDGSKSVKFPERLLRVLEQKLQDIAMRKDPVYTDQLIRRTMAVFYGQFKNDAFIRQMKDNRKIEELILMFATNATSVLKKEPSLAGDGWKVELNSQISQFVKILRDCLRSLSYVSPELLARLDVYTAKLTPSQAASDSGYDSASTSHRDSFAPPSSHASLRDMTLVRLVGRLWMLSDVTLQRDVDQSRQFCTEKAALLDLKTCLKNINAGAPFPGRREDFRSEAAWQAWRTQETSQLSQMILQMMQANPELAKSSSSDPTPSLQTSNARPKSSYSSFGLDSPVSSSRHDSIGSRRSFFAGSSHDLSGEVSSNDDDGDDQLPVGHYFTFIPPNPKRYYHTVVERCLVADLQKMLGPEVDDNEEVPLGILSPANLDLISECALRWRIGPTYRAVCFLDQVKRLYEQADVPLECVPEALQMVTKVMQDVELERWPISDYDQLAMLFSSLFTLFVRNLYYAMDSLPNLKPADIDPHLGVLVTLEKSGLLQASNVDVVAGLADIKDRVRQIASQHYADRMVELQSAPGVNLALPFLLFTDDLEKSAKLLDKRFPEPVLGEIDFVSIFVGVQAPLFVEDVERSQKRLFEDSMNGPTPDVPIQDVFALYRRVKMVMGMHAAFCSPARIDFDIGSFFEPYVRQWLINTDNKTGQWVSAAIAEDKFTAEGPEGHSSSIVDLFDSLRSPISFLLDLDWSDEYQNGRFFTSLSKTISKAVDLYCRSIEDLFMTEMFPRPAEYVQPQKTSAWLEKARQLAVSGEKKVEPYNFLPESCVKLNNISAARKLLDNMYNQMQADKIAETLKLAPPVPEKVDRQRFLFTVKIVIAEGLVPLDSSPSSKLDTFVTLSDENGMRMAKTRTVYETLNPRWDETFDISVEKPLWLMVSVRDRALIGKHDTVGREYICLDPRLYSDFLTHDVWKTLDTQGRILLRISMEGEKDDIQFYFGRAFRSLKRAESDMLRIFIDKMSPFVQQCLSRSVLKSFIKTNSGLDYNKALGNVTALYRSAVGPSASEVQIPLPQAEKPRIKPDELTDVDLEQAILPLFDYFDANLQTLNTHLSDEAKEMVMSRIWKEVLTVIEGLLVPPLSDISSDMSPLSDKEVDVVFKWLKFLRDYFYAGGEGPVSLEILQNQKYRDIFSIRLYYDWTTDALMEECVRMMQQTLRAAPSFKKRAKSVYQQRNLGTIRERKKEKQQEKDVTSGEVIMRILRMRPGTSEFIAHQLQIMATMQAEQEQRARDSERQKRQRPQLPPVPPLPGAP